MRPSNREQVNFWESREQRKLAVPLITTSIVSCDL